MSNWLILLFFLCRCNNGGNMCCDDWRNDRECGCNRRNDCDCDRNRRCNNDCDRNRRNDNDCECERRNERVWERSTSCGCDGDDFIQTRTFSGFQNQSTCGCENKTE